MGCCFSKNKVQDIEQIQPIQQNFENKTEVVNRVTKDLVEEFSDETDVKDKDELTIIDENKSTNELNYELEEWKQILRQLTSNLNIMRFALDLKRSNYSTINDLVKEFAKFSFNNDLEKAWLIYVWITHNIQYDKSLFKITEANEADIVFRTGKCVCSGYSNLFNDLCQRLRVESRKVSGYVKGEGYKLGVKLNKEDQAHAWNAIRIDSKWYYVDTTWGSSGVQTNELKEIIKKDYNPNYFLTPTQILIYTHWTEDFQLYNEDISLDTFEDMLNLKLEFHLNNLICLTHKTSNIKAENNPVFIEFKVPENVYLSTSLEDESKKKLNNLVLVQKDKLQLKEGIVVYLPEMHKNYYLKIFAAKELKSEFVGEFLIKRVINCEDYLFPDYNLSYSHNINLISHKSAKIRSVKTPDFIELSVPRNIEITFDIGLQTGEELTSNLKDKLIIQRDSNTFKYGVFIVNLKLYSFYLLKLYARLKTDSNKDYKHIGQVMIYKEDNNPNENLPNYSLEFNDLKCLSHKSSIIETNKNPLFIELAAPKQTLIIAILYSQNSSGLFENKINESISIQRDSNNYNYGLFVFIPEKNKNYKLQIFAKNDDKTSDTLYSSVDYFFLVKRIKDELNCDFPKYSIEFKYGVKLVSHSSLVISEQNKIVFIEFTAPKDIKIICSLKKKNLSNEFIEIDQKSMLIQHDKHELKYGVFLFLPTKFKIYKFCLFANFVSSFSNSYDLAGELLVLRNGDELSTKMISSYTLEFEYGLKCLSHSSQVIECRSNIEKLIFNVTKTTRLLVNLYDINDNKLENRVLAQRDYVDENNFEISVVLPQKDSFYVLKIFAKDTNSSSDLFSFVTKFILYTCENDINEKDQSYITFYLSDMTSYVVNPVCRHLKLNKTYEFKIYVKNAVKVCLKYRNTWANLIKEDDSIWFLIKSFEAPEEEIGIFASVDSNSDQLYKICSYDVIV